MWPSVCCGSTLHTYLQAAIGRSQSMKILLFKVFCYCIQINRRWAKWKQVVFHFILEWRSCFFLIEQLFYQKWAKFPKLMKYTICGIEHVFCELNAKGQFNTATSEIPRTQMKTLDVNSLMAVVNLPFAAGQLGSGGQESCQNSAAVWAEISTEV